jgi:hypothetical protein
VSAACTLLAPPAGAAAQQALLASARAVHTQERLVRVKWQGRGPEECSWEWEGDLRGDYYHPAAPAAPLHALAPWWGANAAALANASLLSLFLVRQLGEGKIDVNDAERLPNTADMPFLQAAYPLANWSARAAIAARHEWYTRAAWEFLRSDPAVPPAIRAEAAQWGLPLDEFLDTGGFPPQLYVREAARMRGAVVLAQRDVFGAATARSNASVGLSKWLIDIHNVLNMAAPPALTGRGWEVAATGRANTAHAVWQLTEVPYDALTPRRGEASNLLVPVCASFTHVAFSA